MRQQYHGIRRCPDELDFDLTINNRVRQLVNASSGQESNATREHISVHRYTVKRNDDSGFTEVGIVEHTNPRVLRYLRDELAVRVFLKH